MTIASAVLAWVALLALPPAAQAEPGWRIAQYHATMDVNADGSAVILERIDLTFTGARAPGEDLDGLRRLVPMERRGPLGARASVFLKVISVTDGGGLRLPYSVRTWGRQLEVKVPITGQAGATRTVEIDYFVRNAVRYLPDHDEIYWNLTGSSLPTPSEKASARIMLPEKAAEGLRAQAMVGGPDGAQLLPQVRGSTVEFQTWKPMGARAAFTVDVFVPKGVFREPSWWTRAGWFLESSPILLMPLGVLLVMLVLRRLKGRASKMAVAPQYGPPQELTPAEAGTLLTDRVEPRDITATLVDLAVRGYIRIEEDHAGGHRDYVLRLLKPREQWGELQTYEVAMLSNIFCGGQWTQLSSLRLRFAVALPAMRAGIPKALLDKGMYRVDPRTAQLYRLAAVAGVAGLFVLAQGTGLLASFHSALPAAVAVGASAAVVYLLGRRMTPKSGRGLRACARIEGFCEFLEGVDADRLERIPPQQFERYLPYAMALGVEHRWAQAFAGIAREAPEWYSLAAGQEFDASLFGRMVETMADQALAVFTTTPRSRVSRELRAEAGAPAGSRARG